jgi:hypothetical protein
MQLLLRHRLLLRATLLRHRLLLLHRTQLLLLRTQALLLRTQALQLRLLLRLRAQASKLSRRVRLWAKTASGSRCDEVVSIFRAVRRNATDSSPWRFVFGARFIVIRKAERRFL